MLTSGHSTLFRIRRTTKTLEALQFKIKHYSLDRKQRVYVNVCSIHLFIDLKSHILKGFYDDELVDSIKKI